jgi:Fe-S-cluster containining protein
VAECEIDGRLLEKVAEIYRGLDEQIQRSSESAGLCRACGDCCDFDAFDHRLFVTPPEMVYLAAHLGPANVKAMPQSRCPYNTEGKCSVYEHRFAGCRIFCCNGDPDFQSSLSEAAVRRLKSLCTEFGLPYRYTDLAAALNDFARA